MEKEIIWTHRSRENLKSIYNYIANDSELYAVRFVQDLVQHTERRLLAHPLIGKPLSEFSETPLSVLRELLYRGYRVIYSAEGNTIIIIACSMAGWTLSTL